MIRNWWRMMGLITVGALVMAGSAIAAGSTGSTALEAKVINGEVYVKASSLAKQLGGTGVYDAKAQTYAFTPASQVPDVIKKVSPSVVAIIGKPSDSGSSNRYALAHGTGVVWKADGWILTNAHVVKDMTNIVVVTADGKQYEGKRVYIDETSDLAYSKNKCCEYETGSVCTRSAAASSWGDGHCNWYPGFILPAKYGNYRCAERDESFYCILVQAAPNGCCY